jgi:hypothetical protein
MVSLSRRARSGFDDSVQEHVDMRLDLFVDGDPIEVRIGQTEGDKPMNGGPNRLSRREARLQAPQPA